jgi:hypothetical protein
MNLFAAIYHLLTLPINEERIEEKRVQITNVLQHATDVLHISDHLKEMALKAMRNYQVIRRLPEILGYLKAIC